MSRFAAIVTEEELNAKFQEATKNGGIPGLLKGKGQLSKDLAKVKFNLENHDCEGLYIIEETGLNYILCSGGGDWEHPVRFAIYLDKDGKTLRGYIPEAGNPWNKTTKQAYGNDEESDQKDIQKQVRKHRPELIDPAWDDEDDPQFWDAESLFNEKLMQEDIAARIVVAGKEPKKEVSQELLNKHKATILLIKPEITDRFNEIDPNKELNFNSFILGWAVGKGIPVAEAKQIFGNFINE